MHIFIYLFTPALRFSRVWVRKDGSIVMETGCNKTTNNKHTHKHKHKHNNNNKNNEHSNSNTMEIVYIYIYI